MGYILTWEAALDMLSMPPVFDRWLSVEGVIPFVCPVSFAPVRRAIFAADIPSAQRSSLEENLRCVVEEIRLTEPRSVKEAPYQIFMTNTLSSLIGIDVSRADISELDLIPAAIAIHGEMRLVVTRRFDAWIDFAEAAEKTAGHLALQILKLDDQPVGG